MSEPGLKLVARIPLQAPTEGGRFVVPHGLPYEPKVVILQETSGGPIWWQNPLRFDATNLYLIGAPDVTGLAEVLA
jgi:hypothetical protein